MVRVVIEHPYAAGTKEGVERHERYGRSCLAHSLGLGEAPFSSALLYTQEGVLDDTIPDERRKGIEAGFRWREAAEKTVFYGDLGITRGMEMGLEHAISIGCPITFRSLGEAWQSDDPQEPGVFSERTALEWLRMHSKAEWHDKNRYGWMYHMSMMFGGMPSDAFDWNVREDDSERYIIHQGVIGKGFYMVDLWAVNERLKDLADGAEPWLRI